MTTVRVDFNELGDEALACARLAMRGGAIEIQIGEFKEEESTWFASARWKGFRRETSGHKTAAAAANALALVLLDGARCRCNRWVAVERSPDGLDAWCVWRRHGPVWVPGCDALPLHIDDRGDLAAIDRAFEQRHGPAQS